MDSNDCLPYEKEFEIYVVEKATVTVLLSDVKVACHSLPHASTFTAFYYAKPSVVLLKPFAVLVCSVLCL